MENIKNLSSLILLSDEVVFIADDNTIQINGNADDLAKIKGLGFSAEIVQQSKIRIPVRQETLNVFADLSDFTDRILESDFKIALLILNKGAESYFYSNGVTWSNFQITTSDFLISNSYSYFVLLNFLSTQDHKEDSVFYFVDHFNWDNRLIIFTSLKREGKLTMTFPNRLPDFDRRVSLKKRVERFIHAFDNQNKHLPKFIKAELFTFLAKEGKQDRLNIFISKLDEIVDAAEQNHEIYLSDLSLEMLKRDYLEYKEKYFQQARDILGKVTTQIIGLPISLTAAAFASYKVLDSPLTLVLIVVVFLVFSVFMQVIVRLHKSDVGDIREQSKSDFNKLKKSDFFSKYPLEITDFEKNKDRIKARIKTLVSVIGIYYWTLVMTNSSFILFVLQQLKVNYFWCTIVTLVFVALAIKIWVPKRSDRYWENAQ